MSRRIILHDEAFRDLDEISAYIGEDSPRASVRFLESAQKTFRRISEKPYQGAPRDYDNPALIGLRVWSIPNFKNYGVYYLTTMDTVEILRVLHGARDLDALFASREEEE